MCGADDLSLMNAALNQIAANDAESANLEDLRDTLLPKLMSGEIDVSKIDLTQLNNHFPNSLRQLGDNVERRTNESRHS